jgi:hypothetical protein
MCRFFGLVVLPLTSVAWKKMSDKECAMQSTDTLRQDWVMCDA